MSHFETGWKTRDNLTVYAHGWNPEGKMKAVVCLVHGIGDHSGRYAHVGEFLNQAGYALFAFDHRGHGKTEGKRGHIPCCDTVMHDIVDHLKQADEHYPNMPVYLYGQSMGGNLVLNYALRYQPRLTGIISTAPMLRLAFKPSKPKEILAKCLIRLWPTLSMPNGLDTADLSRDPAVVNAYDNDTLTHDRVTPCFLRLIEAGEWALENASQFPLPLLIMHGGEDRITSAEISRDFAERAGELCTLRIWDGLYHEIHNEPEKQEVLQKMVDWLDARLNR